MIIRLLYTFNLHNHLDIYFIVINNIKMSMIQRQSTFGTNSIKQSNYTDCINGNGEVEYKRELQIVGDVEGQIRFTYRRGTTYTMINKDIHLHNTTKVNYIKFKIQSNNPLHYKVYPSSAEIPPQKTIDIIIQITGLDQLSDKGPSFFAKFASDKFKLTWIVYNQSERPHMIMQSKLTSASGSFRQKQKKKLYKVKIHIDEENKEQINQNKTKPIQLGQKVNQILQTKKRQLLALQQKISELQKKKVDKSCLSCGIIMFLSFIAFIGGLLLSY